MADNLSEVTPGIIRLRITQAFADPKARDYGNDYLKLLLEQIQRIRGRINRLVVELVLLVFVYELFSLSMISEVSVSAVTLSDLTILHKLLPVVIGYIYYDLILAVETSSLLQGVFSTTFNQLHSAIAKNQLDTFLIPMTIFMQKGLLYKAGKPYNRGLSIMDISITVILIILTVVGPYIFGAYIIYDLFQRYGLNDIVTWISVTMTILFFAYALITMLYTHRGLEENQERNPNQYNAHLSQ